MHPVDWLMNKEAFMIIPATAALGAAGMGLGTLLKHPVNKYIMYGNRLSPSFNEITWRRPLLLGAGLGAGAGGLMLAAGGGSDPVDEMVVPIEKSSAVIPALALGGVSGLARTALTAPLNQGYNRYIMYAGSPNIPTLRNINWGRTLGVGAGMGVLGTGATMMALNGFNPSTPEEYAAVAL